VAFVIDAYARRILGWKASNRMTTPLVLDAINQAIWIRRGEGITDLSGVIHHNDYAEVCVKPRMCRDGLRSWGLLADFSA
jgi:putative transposase